MSLPPTLYGEGMIDVDVERHLRREVRRKLREHGIDGDAVVFHPYRKDHDRSCLNHPDHPEHGSGMPTKCSCRYVRWGPHWHWIGVAHGHVAPGGHADAPWVFGVIPDKGTGRMTGRRNEYKGIKRFRDLVGLMSYELGHAGYFGRNQVISYGGQFANNKIPKAMLREKVPEVFAEGDELRQRWGERCPACGALGLQVMFGMQMWEFIRGNPWPDPDGMSGSMSAAGAS